MASQVRFLLERCPELLSGQSHYSHITNHYLDSHITVKLQTILINPLTWCFPWDRLEQPSQLTTLFSVLGLNSGSGCTTMLLKIWRSVSVSNPTLLDIFELLRSLSLAHRAAMSGVYTLAELIVVSPATNAVSERSPSESWSEVILVNKIIWSLFQNNSEFQQDAFVCICELTIQVCALASLTAKRWRASAPAMLTSLVILVRDHDFKFIDCLHCDWTHALVTGAGCDIPEELNAQITKSVLDSYKEDLASWSLP